MNCPKCGAKAYVKESRKNVKDNEVYRVHVCPECRHCFYSIEFEVIGDENFLKQIRYWDKYSRQHCNKEDG